MQCNNNRITHFYKKILDNPIGYRIINGSFWSLSGSLLSKSVVFASTIFVAHILGQYEYGEYSMIRSTIFLFLTVSALGAGAATTKYIAENRTKDINVAYKTYLITTCFSVIFSIVTSLLIILFADNIATSQLHNPQLSLSVKLGAILLFFCGVNGTQAGALSGFENFKSIALNSFYSSICELIAILLGAYYYGVVGASVGSGIGYIVLTILNHISISRHFKQVIIDKSPQFCFRDLKIILNFGIPSAFCNLIVALALWYVRTYLIECTNYGEVAIYNAADQVRSFILFIPVAISQIILPMLTNLNSNKENKSYRKVLNINIIMQCSIAGVIALFVMVFSRFILGLWGSEFERPIILILLAASTIFSAFANVVGLAIASQGKMWVGFMFNLLWSIFIIVFSIYFINAGYGATGIAIAMLISYVIHSILQYIYLQLILRKIK